MDVESGLNRRDFLKYAAATGVLVAAGEVLSGAMAEAATGLTEVDKLTIWVLADNYFDSNVKDSKITKRLPSSGGEINARGTRSFLLYRDCNWWKDKYLHVRLRTRPSGGDEQYCFIRT